MTEKWTTNPMVMQMLGEDGIAHAKAKRAAQCIAPVFNAVRPTKTATTKTDEPVSEERRRELLAIAGLDAGPTNTATGDDPPPAWASNHATEPTPNGSDITPERRAHLLALMNQSDHAPRHG